eukprot:TRINITY_DN106265_c0_g1_i1.p1 TRINITY_DN106265_c0_g1~~TRINITY_DN106265_c0_g1_i1.p1  ORF type:complete len:565 (+),score=84.11 TRINITY_DN106265_c0_g1_i1:72-1766(+)
MDRLPQTSGGAPPSEEDTLPNLLRTSVRRERQRGAGLSASTREMAVAKTSSGHSSSAWSDGLSGFPDGIYSSDPCSPPSWHDSSGRREVSSRPLTLLEARDQDAMLKLSAGKRALRRIRLLTGGTLVLMGSSCFVCSIFLPHMLENPHLDWLGHLAVAGTCILSTFTFIFLSMAPLPDDKRLTLCVVLVELIHLTIRLRWFALKALKLASMCSSNKAAHCDLKVIQLSWATGAHVLLFSGLIIALCQKTAVRIQGFMWKCIVLYLAMLVVLHSFATLRHLIIDHSLSPHAWPWLVKSLALWVALSPNLRETFRALLLEIYKLYENSAAAAGLAGFVGQCSAKEVLARGSGRFRCVSLACVTFDDFRDHGAVYDLSQPAMLGDCDAFISHSWSDDVHVKWRTLQQWRSEFKAKNGREPMVWLDKYCIDQSNVQTDLLCLPIFLNGCQELVVLCGPTYLSRLWCIVELFCFVHIGRGSEDIRLLPCYHESDDCSRTRTAIHRFDARTCDCYEQRDKAYMLMAIKSAFGSLRGFNEAVRAILKESAAAQLPKNASAAADDEALAEIA